MAEATEGAEYYDPLRYDPVSDGDVRYTEVKLTEEQTAALAADVTADLVAKVNAGARLFYALYHHRKIVELASDKDYWTPGLCKAYMAAQRAYLGQ